ncbi:hypothetical protein [Pyrobaculum calidifontis]|nr:hypothetical protein [Pyrobaculum calidifontis]
MRMELTVVPECYANACFAQKLVDILRAAHGVNPRVIHRRVSGRDRILNILKQLPQDNVLVIIDYEVGPARKYIDENFDLERVVEGIYVGVFRRSQSVVAVVFDPRIEEAFICRYLRERCNDVNWVRRVKSGEACIALVELFNGEAVAALLRKVGTAIVERLGGN